MKCIDGFWLPDSDTHFPQFAVQPGGIAGYQQAQRDCAYKYVRNWRTAVDVGAHVGIFSRDFAERFDKVWAFEPLNENFACLRKNVPDNVVTHWNVLGDHEDGAFVRLDAPHNTGAAYYDPNADGPMDRYLTMRPLDQFFHKETVGLIKIDVQGMEAEVLRGALDTIKRCKPVLLIEEKGPQVKEARRVIDSLGYTRQEGVGIDRIYTFEEHKFGATWRI